MKMPFELVLGMFIALKKQFEEEDKYRKEQEQKAQGEHSLDVNGYMGQAKSMMGNVQNSVNIPHVSTPSIPHL